MYSLSLVYAAISLAILLTVTLAVSVTALWFESGMVVTVNVYVPASRPEILIMSSSTVTWAVSLSMLAVMPVAPVMLTAFDACPL